MIADDTPKTARTIHLCHQGRGGPMRGIGFIASSS
jgi:hypothetical protein